MLVSRRAPLAFVAVCLWLSVSASAALATGPATVTVRVEGQNETLLSSTQVTTTTEAVVKDGKPEDSCPGTSALGALQLATGGNWSGPWDASFNQYEIYSIEGENHPFGGGAFWDLWVNHIASEVGACEAALESGEEVLFFPCSETATECPSPLGIDAPTTADVGEAVSVTVNKYSATGAASAVAGAAVTGGGAGATTDSSGHATLVFSQPGEITVGATAPETVRIEANICVHNGNDGTCGTHTSTGSSSSPASSPNPSAPPISAPYKGPYALVPKLTSLIEGHVYKRGRAPRVLSGSVLAHTTVSSISLTLRREYRGRCYAFNGVSTRFVRARCGAGRPFKVSNNGLFSYLLPEVLPAGRYVLDIEATDAAGNRTALARGTSRIVFYVR
jgi:hypothetical protein